MAAFSPRPPPATAWQGEFRACIGLAVPLVLTNAIEMAMNITSAVMIGHIGPHDLAASTLALAFYNTALLFGLGLTVAVSPMIARAAADRTAVRRAVQGGVWSAILISGPVWCLLWNAEPIFLALRQDPALSATATGYLRVVQWSFLPAMIYLVLRSMLAALERPRSAVVAGAVGIVINAALNAVLIGGAGPVPALGLPGSGLATLLANVAMAATLGVVVVMDRRFRDLGLLSGAFRPHWATVRALWRLGSPIGIALMLEVGMFTAAAGLIGHYDEPALAAHAIALQVASLTFMVPLGLSQAATVRVGIAAGANDDDGIGRAGWTAFSLGVGAMGLSSIALIAAPRPIADLFLDPAAPGAEAVMQGAVTLLALAGVFQIADGAQVVLAGMLRGLGDTRTTMLIAAVGYWCLGVPLAAVLAPRLGAPGVWTGLVVGLFLAAAMLLARWRWLRADPAARSLWRSVAR